MRNLRFWVVVLAIVGVCSVGGAQEFFDDFESYAPGSEMHGQGGWAGWDDVLGAGAPASDQYAYSGTRSVEIIGSADLVHEFDVTGGRWELSAMQYIPSGMTGVSWFIVLNTYTVGGDPKDWSIQIQFDLAAGTIASSYDGAASAEIVYDEWVEVRCLVNLDDNTVEEYYNGEFYSAHQWDDNVHGTLQVIDLFGNGASSVFYDDVKLAQYFIYDAHEPIPGDGDLGVTQPLLQWTVGDTAKFHDVYFGTSPDLTEADLVSPRQLFNMYYHVFGLVPGTTYYWRVDEITVDGTIYPGEVWTFTAMPVTAYAPSPADGGENAAPSPVLSWLPPTGARQHQVYFGEDMTAVAEGAAETDQGVLSETTFSTGLLRAGTTYYWRVDEINIAGESQVGEVWSFTTGQPVDGKIVRQWWLNIGGTAISALTGSADYPSNPSGTELVDLFEGPVDWADNYGTRLYGWLVPPETGQYTFWIAGDDYQELWLSTDVDPANAVMIANVPGYTSARDFDNTGGTGNADAQKSDPITLQAGQKYYIEALGKEGGGGDSTSVAWQVPGGTREVIPGEYVDTYALAPLKAASPSPANGAADTIQSPILTWFAGENAVQHHVYLGEDAAAVAGADTSSAEYKGQQAGTSYNPGALEWGKAYYWRVDETEADGTVQKGTVWSFATANFIPVEDFESYDDDLEGGTAIFQTWIDGWENSTGSTVGYLEAIDGTFGETTIIHGGGQSMPLDYNNVIAPYYSEAERTWSVPQNWTVNGVDALTLFVRGKSNNAAEALYVAVADSSGRVGVSVHPNADILLASQWDEWKVPLTEFTDAGVNLAAVKTVYIGVGDRDNPTPGGTGWCYVDDIRVTRP